MDGVATEVTTSLVGLGLPGIIIIGLSLVVRSLWQENRSLNKLLYDVSISGVKAIEQNTASLTRLSDMLHRGKEL